jgi:hypothetical protein
MIDAGLVEKGDVFGESSGQRCRDPGREGSFGLGQFLFQGSASGESIRMGLRLCS